MLQGNFYLACGNSLNVINNNYPHFIPFNNLMLIMTLFFSLKKTTLYNIQHRVKSNKRYNKCIMQEKILHLKPVLLILFSAFICKENKTHNKYFINSLE